MLEYAALAVDLLRLGHGLAKSAGLLKSRTDALLATVDAKVSALVEAPLHEGLARLEQAATAGLKARQWSLLEEARGKLTDVVNRSAAPPAIRAYAGVALTATWHHLGEPALALAALDRAERDLEEARRAQLSSAGVVGGSGAGAAAAAGVGSAAVAATILTGGLLAPLAAGAAAHYGARRLAAANRDAAREQARRAADQASVLIDLAGLLEVLAEELRPGPQRINGALAL